HIPSVTPSSFPLTYISTLPVPYFFFSIIRPPPNSTLFPYTTLFRSHRDIKPANIFVCRYGEEYDFVKVLDFGIVRAVHDAANPRSEEHTSELQSLAYLVCRLLLEKKKKKKK